LGSFVPIRLDNHPIAYFATPKVASTSIKLALYLLDTGQPWSTRCDNGKWVHIHNGWKPGGTYFKPLHQDNKAWRFAVIRDPVDRIISCYRNRVCYHNDLTASKINMSALEALGLPKQPTLNEFIVHLDGYRAVAPQIAHDTRLQCISLGPDLDYYHRLYKIEELSALPDEIHAMTGTRIELPVEQSGGPDVTRKSLSRRALAMIRHLFVGDYVLLKRYYAPPI
jgi:hypothetical protein